MSKPTMITPTAAGLPRGLRWQPDVGGKEATRLLESKLRSDAAAISSIRNSAGTILGRAFPPGTIGHETGLIVGYVQSGKTLSFTTVAALARDNQYPLVIVIAGSSVQLSEQSRDRLRTDLAITPDRPRTWALFHNPRKAQAGNIQRIMDEWLDINVPMDARQTVLITVMKQYQNLQHLISLINSLNLSGISALIIDDEADQASLNNEVPQNSQSTTYRRLLELRSCLPMHTLLQYTATPQAPLLINIIDTLSPNFVEVLDPGSAYTGGKDFFVDHPELIRIIPAQDVPTQGNPLSGAPDSLIEALRVFIVGVAVGLKLEGGAGNRSMLVHPSHRTTQHQGFYTWIYDAIEEWRRVIKAPSSDMDRQQLIDDFRIAHEDLRRTAPEIPPFDELTPLLSSALNRTSIEEVNRRQGKAVIIDWGQQYAWILVGGQAMDRGYTVEGLTVTYMPRGIGTGNADTVQQRARFFGYKRKYQGYCRIYLESQTRNAFGAYVEHEEFMRSQLKLVAANGSLLNDWKRAFVLDPSLKPCRDSVLEFDYVRSLMTSEWYAPDFVLSDTETRDLNRNIVREFLASISLHPDKGDTQRTIFQRHRFSSDVSLRHMVERLVTQFRIHDPIDSQRLIGVLVQLATALEGGGDEPCTVYEMSGGELRERKVDANGKIANLFQGAAPVTPKDQRGSIYPGDRAMHADDAVTVQIHNLRLTHDSRPIAEGVPSIAIWIPPRLTKPWLIQNQPTQRDD